jgi:hypothetical protein
MLHALQVGEAKQHLSGLAGIRLFNEVPARTLDLTGPRQICSTDLVRSVTGRLSVYPASECVSLAHKSSVAHFRALWEGLQMVEVCRWRSQQRVRSKMERGIPRGNL